MSPSFFADPVSTMLRETIFASTFGWDWFRRFTISKAFAELQKRSYAFAKRMRESHSWDGRDLNRIANCPPVTRQQQGRLHCGRVRNCPHCFARRTVLPAYRTLCKALESDDFKACGDLKMIGFSHRYWAPGTNRSEQIALAISRIKRFRLREVNCFRAVGGVLNHRMSLKSPKAIVWQRTGILFVPAETEPLFRQWVDARRNFRKLWVGQKLNRAAVRFLIGKLFRFEPTMLTAYAADISELVQSTRRVRFTSSLGLCHGFKGFKNQLLEVVPDAGDVDYAGPDADLALPVLDGACVAGGYLAAVSDPARPRKSRKQRRIEADIDSLPVCDQLGLSDM